MRDVRIGRRGLLTDEVWLWIYRKIKTSRGNIYTAPMASGGGLADLILLCLVLKKLRVSIDAHPSGYVRTYWYELK